jgi:hypothetical protein
MKDEPVKSRSSSSFILSIFIESLRFPETRSGQADHNNSALNDCIIYIPAQFLHSD